VWLRLVIADTRRLYTYIKAVRRGRWDSAPQERERETRANIALLTFFTGKIRGRFHDGVVAYHTIGDESRERLSLHHHHHPPPLSLSLSLSLTLSPSLYLYLAPSRYLTRTRARLRTRLHLDGFSPCVIIALPDLGPSLRLNLLILLPGLYIIFAIFIYSKRDITPDGYIDLTYFNRR
jgi:hypothetical protein